MEIAGKEGLQATRTEEKENPEETVVRIRRYL